MQTIQAKITVELEITVESAADQFGFDVKEIAAVTGYDGANKAWTMTPAFAPDDLVKLVEQHFARDAQSAIDEEAAEARAAYLDGLADVAHERRMEAF